MRNAPLVIVFGVLSVLGNVALADQRMASSTAVAPDVATAPRLERYLTAREITSVVSPHASEIQQCYRDHAGELTRSAKLDVTLSIGRAGKVVALHAAVNGKPTEKKIESCIRTAVEGVQFPARRNDTTAVVPFWFHKAEARNAGPQMSCYSATGC